MSKDVEVTTNALELKNFLNKAKRDQVPFATSKAINALTRDTKKVEQSKLEQYFDIRTPWMTKSGAMPIKWSHKNQFPDIHAILGVKDDIAAQNITGEDRRGKMAVPLSRNVAGINKSTREELNPSRLTLGPSKFPRRIVKKTPRRKSRRKLKPIPFYAKTRGGETGVFIRTGNGQKIKALYLMKKKVRMDKNWPLVQNVEQFIAKYYEQQLNYELSKAMKYKK